MITNPCPWWFSVLSCVTRGNHNSIVMRNDLPQASTFHSHSLPCLYLTLCYQVMIHFYPILFNGSLTLVRCRLCFSMQMSSFHSLMSLFFPFTLLSPLHLWKTKEALCIHLFKLWATIARRFPLWAFCYGSELNGGYAVLMVGHCWHVVALPLRVSDITLVVSSQWTSVDICLW